MPRPKGPTLTFIDRTQEVLALVRARNGCSYLTVKQHYGKRGVACADRLASLGRLVRYESKRCSLCFRLPASGELVPQPRDDEKTTEGV